MVSDIPTSGSAVPAQAANHPWRRYVALGDSFTEGIGDPDPHNPGRHRGWADRVAQQLSTTVPDFAYANLAIRGRLINQIVAEQVEPAIELKPDLISICAGGNDVIRPGGDPDKIAEKLDGAINELSGTGATIVLLTGPDIRDTPVLGGIRGKVAIYNENVRAIAQRYDAVVGDLWALSELRQTPMWDPDRLHFSPAGHQIISAMVLDALNVPHEPVMDSQLEHATRSWREARIEDLQWAREYFGPWILRRIRHQSSGDGVSAKRPLPTPFTVLPPNASLGAGDSAPGQK